MPPEITLVGEAFLSGWGWEIAIDLFLGGVVAGLMVFSGVMVLFRPKSFTRALFLADLTAFPILAVGMLFLFLDLSNKLNVWRLYTTFQVTSPMSWGAWILLLAMITLALRFVACVPPTQPAKVLGLALFIEGGAKKTALVSFVEWAWGVLARLGAWVRGFNRILVIIGLVLGIGIGLYTGALLSSMPAHPLWNSAFLAPLFLVSGILSGGALLTLLAPEDQRKALVPWSLALSGLEALLLAALAFNMLAGTPPQQRSAPLLLEGTYGWLFWGVVVILGALVPVVMEWMDIAKHGLPLQQRLPSILKLAGRFALRVVIVFAGLLSFV